MARLSALILASLAFAAGFALLFLAQFVLSPLSRSVWLVPGLILVVALLLGALPSYRPVESRLSAFFAYGASFGLVYLNSLPAPSLASAAERISQVAVPMLMITLTLALAGYIGAWRFHRSAVWLSTGFALGLLVAYFSGVSGGTGGGAWERWLMDSLGLSAGSAEVLVIALRKTIHFAFYGLLATVFWRAARAEKVVHTEAALFAILLSASHAGFDELRQSMTPDRTGSILDFCIDLAGAIALVWLVSRRNRPQASGTSS